MIPRSFFDVADRVKLIEFISFLGKISVNRPIITGLWDLNLVPKFPSSFFLPPNISSLTLHATRLFIIIAKYGSCKGTRPKRHQLVQYCRR